MRTQKYLSELSHGELFTITASIFSSKSIYVALGDVVKPAKMHKRICRNYATSEFVFVENMPVFPLGNESLSIYNL